MSEKKELSEIIFMMLNFTNMYCLALDDQIRIKFVNLSLATDLGYQSYNEVIDRCWLDFLGESDREIIKVVHESIAYNKEDWETKYREVQNNIIARDGKIIPVYWFNSHINSEINWTFSFGIKKPEVKEDDVRHFYQDLIKKDRVMINSLRDSIGLNLRDKIVDTCKESLI